MSNTLADLKSTFWNMSKAILADIITEEPDRWIRKMYPRNGAPDWTVDDNIVFLNLTPRDDDYAKQRDSEYIGQDNTIMRHAMRTRVWDLEVNAYGPRSYDMVTAMKDGVFSQSIKMFLAKKDIYLVPLMQTERQANEIFAGQWWERWDITLTFNERYVAVDDVGRIEEVSIRAEALR